MVFLIQNTQNRDTLALQLKLDELLSPQRHGLDRGRIGGGIGRGKGEGPKAGLGGEKSGINRTLIIGQNYRPTSMSTPGRDLLISTSGRLRSSMITSRSRLPSFLDGHVAVPASPADCHITVMVNALFVADGADAILVADPLCARRHREQSRPCHRDRASQDMSCSHLWLLHQIAQCKTRWRKGVPKVPSLTVRQSRCRIRPDATLARRRRETADGFATRRHAVARRPSKPRPVGTKGAQLQRWMRP
jgi:hypothetical protein